MGRKKVQHSSEEKLPILKSTLKLRQNKNCVPFRFKLLNTIVSARKRVFSIDHLMEQILNGLSTRDLLSCRLFCKRWNLIATRILVKRRLEVHFSSRSEFLTLQNLMHLLNSNHNPTYNNCLSTFFPVTVFNLSSSLKISSFRHRHSHNYPSDFPEYMLISNLISHPNVIIKELTLNLYVKDMKENVVMERLGELLMAQASNLCSLLLIFLGELKTQWKIGGNTRSLDFNSPLKKTDPEFKEIHLRYRKNLNHNQNQKPIQLTKLRKIRTFGQSAKVLEMILALAPYLNEVITTERSYGQLLEPVDRLYLLRWYAFRPGSPYSINIAQKISTTCSEKLMQLRELDFYLDEEKMAMNGTNKSPEEIIQRQRLRRRIVTEFNNLLECCKETLVILRWTGVTILEGFRCPKGMPKVNELELSYPFELKPFQQRSIFPLEFKVEQVFPTLEIVRFTEFDDCENFYCLLCSLYFGEVHSVKYCEIILEEALHPDQLDFVQKMFPKAEIAEALPCSDI